MANKLSVAFIGTGIMGAPIAGHILDAGYPVTVNNRTKSKAAALVERGAVWADTPADAVANADVVFTMVGYPSEVEELYLAGDGLLACTKPGFMVEHFIKDLRLALAYADDRELALPGADVAFTLYDMLDAIGGAKLGTQAITVLYKEEADAIAAGLDWSQYRPEEHGAHEEGCGCGEHGDEHECGCGHHHGEDHECCGGHGHDDGHECCCGHHHEE